MVFLYLLPCSFSIAGNDRDLLFRPLKRCRVNLLFFSFFSFKYLDSADRKGVYIRHSI